MTFIKHHLKYLPWFFAGVFCVVGSYDHFFNDDQWIARVMPEQTPSVGADVRTFTSAQVGSDPDNGDCLTTDGSISTWSATCGGGGGGSGVGWASTTGDYVLYNTLGSAVVLSSSDRTATHTTAYLNVFGGVSGDYFQATSSSASSTFNGLTSSNLAVTGKLYAADSPGASSTLLQSTATGVRWTSTTTLGISGAGDGVSNWQLTVGALRPSTTVGILVNASSTIGDNTAQGGLTVRGTATTSNLVIDTSGTITFAGDALDELVGTGLQVVTGDLQTTLGTAITPGELSSTDFGDFSCVAGTCTVDSNTIATADIIDGTIQVIDLATSTQLASSSILSIDASGLFTKLTCAQITGDSGLCDGNDASAGAGIATSTPIANKEIIYATAINTVGSEAAFTYDSATDLLTVVNATATAASSTNLYGSLGRFLNLVVTTLATFLNVVVTGLLDVGDGSLEIPNGTNPTIDSVGEIGVDTTTGQFLFSTSTTDLSVKLPLEINRLAYSSTTWGGTTTIPWGGASGYPLKVYDINCATIGGGTASLVLGSGSATSTVALITGTPATTTLNIAFHGGEMPRFEIGTPASSPRYVGCTFRFKYDRQ